MYTLNINGVNQLQVTGLSKRFVNLKVLESRKCSKNFQFWNARIITLSHELPNSCIYGLQKTAEVIFERLVNVTIICQVLQKFKWSYQAIFNLLRSATNIFLMETLVEHHELKSNMPVNEEYIIGNIKEYNPEKKSNNIIKVFLFNKVLSSCLHPSNFLPNNQHIREGKTIMRIGFTV